MVRNPVLSLAGAQGITAMANLPIESDWRCPAVGGLGLTEEEQAMLLSVLNLRKNK